MPGRGAGHGEGGHHAGPLRVHRHRLAGYVRRRKRRGGPGVQPGLVQCAGVRHDDGAFRPALPPEQRRQLRRAGGDGGRRRRGLPEYGAGDAGHRRGRRHHPGREDRQRRGRHRRGGRPCAAGAGRRALHLRAKWLLGGVCLRHGTDPSGQAGGTGPACLPAGRLWRQSHRQGCVRRGG